MEKRIGVVAILITHKESVSAINSILSFYGELIIGRQGIPLRDKNIQIISLVVEGTTDEISALTGKIGRLEGVEVKSILTKYREKEEIC